MTNFAGAVRTPQGRVNLVANPSFEYGSTAASTNFTVNSNAVISVVAAPVLRGSNAMLVKPQSSATVSVYGYTDFTNVPILVTAGLTYTFTVNVRNGGSSTTRTATPALLFCNSIGSLVNTVAGTATTVSTTGWTTIAVSGVPAATAVFAQLRLNFSASTASDSYFVDCITVEQTASTVLPYFDGTFDGSRWRGAAHASVSESFSADAAGGIVQNVAVPVLGTDAANKTYVDGALGSGMRVSSSTRRQNLLTNPSFTTAVTGWYGAVATVAWASAPSMFGAGNLSATASSTGTASAATLTTAVTASAGYTFSAYLRPTTLTASSATAFVKIDWYSVTGSGISSSTGTGQTVAVGAWNRLSVTSVAPANATYAVLSVSWAATSGDVVVVDGAMLEASATLGSYFDGTVAGARWLGTANASASELLNVDVNGNTVANVATPVLAGDGANKSYVDAAVQRPGPLVAAKRVNLCPNPSFEVSTVGWSASTGTLSASSAWSASGTNSLRIATTATTAVTITSPWFPVSGSGSYMCSWTARSLSGVTTQAVATIQFASNLMVATSSVNNLGQATVTDTGGVRQFLGGTADAGAAYARLMLVYTPASASTEAHGFDAFLFEAVSSIVAAPDTYFDGSSANCRWTGTAGVSVSEQAVLANTVPVLGAGQITAAGLGLTRAYATNLMPNPGFNAAVTTGWTPTNATLSAVTTAPFEGVYCMQVVATSNAVQASLASPSVTVTPGVTYTVSCAARTAVTGRQVRMDVVFYDRAGALLSTVTGTTYTDTTAWQVLVSPNNTAPAGAVTMSLTLQYSTQVVNEVHFLDAFNVEVGTTRSGYFDGNSPGWRWLGTADLSASETLGGDANLLPVANVGTPQLAGDAANKGYADAHGYPLKQTFQLTAATATVQFTVPSTVRNIAIRYTGKSTDTSVSAGVVSVYLRVNNIGNGVYYQQILLVQNATSTPSNSVTTQVQVGNVPNAAVAASRFGWGHIDLTGWDYATYTADSLTFSSRAGCYPSAAASVLMTCNGLYLTAGPWSTIQLYLSAGNWAVGSQFTITGE